MVKKFAEYELSNGKTLEFSSLGCALEYCHKHNINIVRVS